MADQAVSDVVDTSHAAMIEPALFRKMAWRIMPLLFLGWVLNWIDRINIGFAHLSFQKQFGMTEAAFGVIVGVYAIGYLALEVPSNLLMQRIGARKTLSRIMILWGIVTVVTAFAQSTTQLLWLRVVLGITEAGFFPGVILYLSFWFPSAYRARITARFILANAVSGIIGGPLAGWILTHMANVAGLHAWQWLFILEGIAPIALGVALYFYLSDKPESASWLTVAEKAALANALQADRERQKNTRHKGFFDTLKDRRVYFLAIAFCLAIMVTGNVVNVWAPAILRTAGVLSLGKLGLLSSLPYIVGILCMFIVTRWSDARRERRWHFAVPAAVAAFGIVLIPALAVSPTSALVILSIATAGYLSATAMFWTIPTFYLSEPARPGGIALINTVGQLGGLLTPMLIGWIRTSSGSLSGGLYIVAPLIFVGACIVVLALPASMTRDGA